MNRKENLEILIIENAEQRVGNIRKILASEGVNSRLIRIYKQEKLPSLKKHEAIIVSGGPMGVYELHKPEYNYILEECDFLNEAINQGKAILGVCFGHQLLAHILSADVERCEELAEIGWSKIRLNSQGEKDPLFKRFSPEFVSFQYHYDQIIELPAELINLGSSSKCPVQAFRYKSQPVWGVQFHPEISPQQAKKILLARRGKLEEIGIDVFLTINRGMELGKNPGEQIFYNFIKAIRE